MTRLTPRGAVTDRDVFVGWLLHGVLAQADPQADPGTAPYLSASAGRSRSGRGTRYFLALPGLRVHRFQAFTDAEALTHAEAYLAKHQPAPADPAAVAATDGAVAT